jgi:hypothetical protein
VDWGEDGGVERGTLKKGKDIESGEKGQEKCWREKARSEDIDF